MFNNLFEGEQILKFSELSFVSSQMKTNVSLVFICVLPCHSLFNLHIAKVLACGSQVGGEERVFEDGVGWTGFDIYASE